jgi:dipeptidyl aminopeptidase/acylaminoacyl peptidase
MKLMNRLLVCVSCCLPAFAAAESTASKEIPLIPIEDLFRPADVSTVRLSPDGAYLSFLTTLGTGRVGIVITEMATGKTEPLVAAQDENIRFSMWKGNDFIIYGGDFEGNESLALRGIDLKTRHVVELAESFRERDTLSYNSASIVDPLVLDPSRIVILGNGGTGSLSFGAYYLNVRTGKRAAIHGLEKDDIQGIMVDNAGRLRCRDRFSGDEMLHEIRVDPSSSWYVAARTPIVQAASQKWNPLYFDGDDESLYVGIRGENDTVNLHAFNTKTRVLGPVLFCPEGGEISGLVSSYDRSKLYGVVFMTDRPRYRWFDADRERLQAMIDRALPGAFNEVVSTTADEKQLVIASQSDRSRTSYFALDRRGPKPELKVIYKPSLPPLQAMQPITYTARDGLVIPGYLTLPPGAQGKRVPLILHPHGGPYGIRDEWGFDPEVQFYANRGFAVLQPNYRGSGGYGFKFLDAGRGEWGRKMQDDLTDAVKWAIDQGIADPDRVCISGASYGGYAALAGVTFTPDLYRCAINYVGVSDLAILNEHTFDAGRGTEEYFKKWMGNDMESMRARSPINFVERIRVPTLHAYGENDPRVDIKHWKYLKAQLDKQHKVYEFVRVANEGHGFYKAENAVALYGAIEKFLDKYLAPVRKAVVIPGTPEVIAMPAPEPTKK